MMIISTNFAFQNCLLHSGLINPEPNSIEVTPMGDGRGKRQSPRVPVYMDVRVDLIDGSKIKGKAIDLNTEGISIKTDAPLFVKEEVTLEFLLPDTLNSIQLEGQVIWYRYDYRNKDESKLIHFSGINFLNLPGDRRKLICDYGLKMLHDKKMVLKQGIDRVLSDILNLPANERAQALRILTQKGFLPSKETVDVKSEN